MYSYNLEEWADFQSFLKQAVSQAVSFKEGLMCFWEWIFLIFPTSVAELSLVSEDG